MKNLNATVNAILTFESEDNDGNTQEFYDVDLCVKIPENDENFGDLEVAIIKQVLENSIRDHSDLVKISLFYEEVASEDNAEVEKSMNYLTRNNAKYYFQPNQRDDYEQAIVDALGVASKTKDFE